MKRRLILITAVALLFTLPVAAQLGLPGLGGLGGLLGPGGIPVFDGSNMAENVKQTIQAIAQVKQLVQTYERITQQYDHMIFQAKYIKNQFRYQTPLALWKGMATTDTYGKTGQWVRAVNTGLNGAQAWANGTMMVMTYQGDSFQKLSPAQVNHKSLDYAGIELADGTAASAIESIGVVRGNGPATEKALKTLEEDSFSDTEEMQTVAAQLNKANALSLLQAKAVNDSNRLAVANAEIGIVQMRQFREAAAYALQNDIEFRLRGKQVIDSQLAGASDAMRSFQLP